MVYDHATPGGHKPPLQGDEKRTVLSKNKREQIEKEVAELEHRIASVEHEIAQLELSFQQPPAGTDWQSLHRRYAELKETLDVLYKDLGRRWEMIG